MSNHSLAVMDKEKALEEFRRELEADGFYNSEVHDDYLLARFLRARKYDIPRAKPSEFNVEDVVASFGFPEAADVRVLYPRFYHKTDKRGRPVYFELLGSLDVKKLWAGTMRSSSVTVSRPPPLRLTLILNKSIQLCQEDCSSSHLHCAKLLPRDPWKDFGLSLNPCLMRLRRPFSRISIAENLPVAWGGACNSCMGGCEHSDPGPWNDGSVPGYPNELWENMKFRDVKSV
ncbi:hypothetical protein BC829DRAFT_394374 [Chytridium lagenaria]|nr:hypothetical protein BC829DRAFT_394374 [Chytridium lagenaria]